MRVLPFGPLLPLHCCCDPALRLGWVPKPPRVEGPGKVVFVAGLKSTDLLTGEEHYPERIYTETAYLHTTTPGGHTDYRLAVKSNDVPIETWRKVPGFIEDRRRV
jgi:hypothetical protein